MVIGSVIIAVMDGFCQSLRRVLQFSRNSNGGLKREFESKLSKITICYRSF